MVLRQGLGLAISGAAGDPMTSTKASAVIGPTPGWVISRSTSGR